MRIPQLSNRATAVFSVTMVLLILGIVSLLAIGARRVGEEVKESVGYVVVERQGASDAEIASLSDAINSAPSTRSASRSSADDVLARWEAMQPADSSSLSITEMLGLNPFCAEWEVKVTEPFASTDSLERIVAPLRAHPAAAEVVVHQEMIDAINSTVDTVTLALLIIAAAMLVISIALINNTVCLSIYARRFTIHTMRLVGATPSYILRPILLANIISGIIAALLSYAILAMLLYYCRSIDPAVVACLSARDMAFTGVGMLLAGILICGVAAFFAANRYLRISYDDMFYR
ncbi:MAG: hypothetical protein NC342_00385 [Pseudoflavonifractor sp.]|nr:hypothetical protein [Alloprevotella sp.]MCM1115985.1 hypothetical protein [Pseudoflavonifractor sp.]